ncbi:type I-U CRISPR-associated RAMP protein Csb1/Cas7u [Gemmatimonas sp.]|uniref:type I-G CRISPR-associated RAMP protein Csb1/Cas7g n=1 Tax=Gemmatimonas sp. TaxID=1962908 RepID=UPI00334240C6
MPQFFSFCEVIMNYESLRSAVASAAAIRRVRRLQPVGGPGDKLFPPTYPNDKGKPPRHVTEDRRIGGSTVPCVLCDSAASQANRMEEALEAALRSGRLQLPSIAVDFSGTHAADIGTISALEAPHRVYDAILRDSRLGEVLFRESEIGRSLVLATTRDASALYRYAPTSLVFGAWNSTGGGGGLGAKFPRSVVSEIVGVNVQMGARVGSRMDPLGIRAGIAIAKDVDGSWRLVDANTKTAKKEKIVKPSEINHGNIAPTIDENLGVTVDYALQTWVLSLASLRRLRFVPSSDEAEISARAVLAAVALVALVELDISGYALRSRCDLVPDIEAPAGQRGELQIVNADGSSTTVSLDRTGVYALLRDATAAAEAHGLPWHPETIRLEPDARLVELVLRSRALALAGKGEDDDTGE